MPLAVAAALSCTPGAERGGTERSSQRDVEIGGQSAAAERRLLSVVLLAPADGDPITEDDLRRAIRPYGGRMEQLADGDGVWDGDERDAHTDPAEPDSIP